MCVVAFAPLENSKPSTLQPTASGKSRARPVAIRPECPFRVKRRHRRATRTRLLWPQQRTLIDRSGSSAKCQEARSFDHFGRLCQDRIWYGEAKGFRSLEINDEIEPGRL